jgi:hypothetical protein
MTNLKILPVRSAGALTCVWMPTGNSRAPLTALWVPRNTSRTTASIATDALEGRRCA